MTMTNPNQLRNAKELNAARMIVYQSTLCHPDWDAFSHASYLESEHMFDLDKEYLFCVWPVGPKLYPLRQYVENWVKFPNRLADAIRKQK